MSSGQKRAYEDECDWEELQRVYKLKNTWKHYSVEAVYAREYIDSNVDAKAPHITLYVKHKLEQRALQEKQYNERMELNTYEKLKEKFE